MHSKTQIATGSVTNVCQNGQVSDTVVTAVAEAKGVDPLDLEPLYNVVDPDALNAMYRPSGSAPSTDVEVSFSMAGCEVVVHADGEVVVTPATEDEVGQPAITSLDD